MVNGFDANKVVHRQYTTQGRRHAGVFVTPDLRLAEHFSGGGDTVLEIEVLAKNLHGTNYGGNIGREQSMDPETVAWLQEKYPDSFRPYLSLTLLQTSEPQALLRGLVRPGQIKRVQHKGTWYTRKAFLELGVEVHNPYGKGEPLQDIGFDLSYPNYSLEEFFEAMAASFKMGVDRIRQSMLRLTKLPSPRRERAIMDILDRAGFGPTAAKAFESKLMAAGGV